MDANNLTPNPFPQGKGNNRVRSGSPSRAGRGRTQHSGSPSHSRRGYSEQSGSPSHYGKGLGVRSAQRPSPRLSPFHWGKGLGVRLFGAKQLLMLLALIAGCAPVQEQMFTLHCAIGREPLTGELAPGTAMALDISTSPIPLFSPPHRAIARCDDVGQVTLNIETPADTGLSQLSSPLSTAASHVTFVP